MPNSSILSAINKVWQSALFYMRFKVFLTKLPVYMSKNDDDTVLSSYVAQDQLNNTTNI